MTTPIFSKLSRRGALLALTIIAFSAQSCRQKDERPLQSRMRDSYTAITDLYKFAAVPSDFENPRNHSEISRLLKRLSNNFHTVESITPVQEFEPGFRIALQLNQEILTDATTRFADGEKEYAGWRLRGLLNSCVACHTRYRISADFTGEVPKPQSGSIRDRLAVSEYLVATRQFERAEQELFQLSADALSSKKDPSQALKLWLLVQMRVRGTPEAAKGRIEQFLERTTALDLQSMLLSWRNDLQMLSIHAPNPDPIAEAQWLLVPALQSTSIHQNDLALVRTFRATTILHPLLLTRSLTREDRAEATALLALAYDHIDIRTLDTFRTEYLEQCIREFPQTPQARRCFQAFQQEIEFESSGSAGIQIPEEEAAKLRELRTLAHGDEQIVLPDSASPVPEN